MKHYKFAGEYVWVWEHDKLIGLFSSFFFTVQNNNNDQTHTQISLYHLLNPKSTPVKSKELFKKRGSEHNKRVLWKS